MYTASSSDGTSLIRSIEPAGQDISLYFSCWRASAKYRSIMLWLWLVVYSLERESKN